MKMLKIYCGITFSVHFGAVFNQIRPQSDPENKILISMADAQKMLRAL